MNKKINLSEVAASINRELPDRILAYVHAKKELRIRESGQLIFTLSDSGIICSFHSSSTENRKKIIDIISPYLTDLKND